MYYEVFNIGLSYISSTGLPSLPLTRLITFSIFLFPSWSGNKISDPSNISSLLQSFVSRDKSSISGRSYPWLGSTCPFYLEPSYASSLWSVTYSLKNLSNSYSVETYWSSPITFSNFLDNPEFYSWSQYSIFRPVWRAVLQSLLIQYQFHLWSIRIASYLCGGKHQAVFLSFGFPTDCVYPNTNISHLTQSPSNRLCPPCLLWFSPCLFYRHISMIF